MKKTRIISLVLCLFLIFQVPFTADAAEPGSTGTLNWRISSIRLDHKEIQFHISGVDSAQTASLAIEDPNTPNDRIEIPFEIKSSAQDISLAITGQDYLEPVKKYNIYVTDASGNRTEGSTASIPKHHYYVDYTAYPNWLEIRNESNVPLTITAKVNFETYPTTINAKSSGRIEYPSTEVGTTVEATWSDGYGCEETREISVTDQIDENIPYVYVWKDSITAYYSSLSENCRLAARVEGKNYYSDYGLQNGMTNHYITYPAVSDTTTAIDIWIEGKNGTKSQEEKKEISDCELSQCNISANAYPAKATGTVEANEYDQKITKVGTTIGGKTYSCDVSANGTFSLNYPAQEDYADITLEFSDAHGCKTEQKKYVLNNCFYDSHFATVLISKAYAALNNGERLAVKIGQNTYYSPYASASDNEETTVTVTYPRQSPSQQIQLWVENSNSSRSKIWTTTPENRTFEIDGKVKTTSATFHTYEEYEEDYEDYTDENSNHLSASVFINGKEYSCTMKVSDDGTDFNVKYPLQKVGTSVKFVVKDTDGYEAAKSFTIKNIKPTLKLNSVTTSSKKITGTTKAGSSIVLKVGKKSYKTKANKKGTFSVKIKSQKSGTKIKVTVKTPDGYSTSKTIKVKIMSGSVVLTKNVYKNSKSISLKLYHMVKGDTVKVTIGKKTYKKKIKSNKNTQKYVIKIKKASAGTKIKIKLYDKFKKNKGSATDVVYYGNKIRIGMKARDVLLTTYGTPNCKNHYGKRLPEQWVYDSGRTITYVYISGGKVVDIQKINY